jgi:hypothetical protein
MVRERDQAELAALQALDRFVRGEQAVPRPAKTNGAAVWTRDDAEIEHRAKVAKALEVMRAGREKREAEITAAITALAGALDIDPDRLAKVAFVRAQIGQIVHMIRQVA